MSSEEQVRQAFAVFDTDNTGALDRAQFKEVLMAKREDGAPLSEEDVNAVFDAVDTDNSGRTNISRPCKPTRPSLNPDAFYRPYRASRVHRLVPESRAVGRAPLL